MLDRFFETIDKLIIRVVLLTLLLIGAYKVIRSEWPSDTPVKSSSSEQTAPPRQTHEPPQQVHL
jgi:hypothetical protein